MVLKYILSGVIGYLLGNISSGVLISKGFGIRDIRKHGSGNSGTTNVLRTLGWLPSVLTLVCDCLKGFVACMIGKWLGGDLGMLIGGFCAVLGHDYPVFFGFKGGKGIATSLALIISINPWLALAELITEIVVVAVTRYMSIASLVTTVMFPVFTAIICRGREHYWLFVAFSIAAAALSLFIACCAQGGALAEEASATGLAAWFEGFKKDFNKTFIVGQRWKRMFLVGLGNTMKITVLALLLGLVIGTIIAAIRSTYYKTADSARPTVGRRLFGLLNGFCKVYLTVLRGTPVMVQLMIIVFVIFKYSDNGVMLASLAFGLNSGAYVAEIIRGGIMSIDNGQFEAGRSLGFNYIQTMRYVVLPQVIKNVLPALMNEFIALLKETSVAGYAAVRDLTYGGNTIAGQTYSYFMPLIAVALIYLTLVMFLTWVVGRVERRLRSNDH